ncbi:MAG: DUF2189 domain-containing protein [Rhodocyclales bacterium GT-UBC]|nr:MAG: DUF2189 domain-containing protein [Rhodocyclales bacterium GT-UBC]
MRILPFSIATLFRALRAGWSQLHKAWRISVGYASIFVLAGALIMGMLLRQGWVPFLIPAAGSFMLVGPLLLAGYFGIASASQEGRPVDWRAIRNGYAHAAPSLGALALVCCLLLMIFLTDAAILYAYMVGGPLVELGALLDGGHPLRFIAWSGVSGAFIAFLLYGVTAFSVPLLCERRAGLVESVVISVRVVFSSFVPAMIWACLLSCVTISSVLLLPILPLTLSWLAFSSRALYREVLPC